MKGRASEGCIPAGFVLVMPYGSRKLSFARRRSPPEICTARTSLSQAFVTTSKLEQRSRDDVFASSMPERSHAVGVRLAVHVNDTD